MPEDLVERCVKKTLGDLSESPVVSLPPSLTAQGVVGCNVTEEKRVVRFPGRTLERKFVKPVFFFFRVTLRTASLSKPFPEGTVPKGIVLSATLRGARRRRVARRIVLLLFTCYLVKCIRRVF